MTRHFAAALLVVAALATPAAAVTVSATAVPDKLPNGTADDVNILFSGLAASDGSGGKLTIVGTAMDLGNDFRETMRVTLDTVDLGQWVCFATPTTAPSQPIPGAVGANLCNFTLNLDIGGTALDGVLADGNAALLLEFGSFVIVNATSRLDVTLSYTALAPVPLPAGALFLATGLGGLVALRRKRQMDRRLTPEV